MGLKTILAAAAALALMAGGAHAQSIKDYPEVVDTSSVEPDGSKVLQIAVDIPVERSRVWRQFTTTDGYKAWAVPVGQVDFRLGGVIEGSYDYHAKLGDPDNIKNRIIAYVPGRLVAIQNVQAPAALPGRKEFGEIVTTIEFADAGPAATRVTLTAVGYKPGEPYDTLYKHFGWGNAYTLMKLKQSLVKGPIDWKAAEAREQAQAAAKKVTEAAR